MIRALAFALLLLPASASALVRVPVVVHVAQRAGEPVATEAFVTEQLEHANALFRPLDFELVPRVGTPLPEKHAELVSRRDRDVLARFVRGGAIHCFVVAKLMDVDEPERERRGVHWHPRGAPGRHYVIVSKISGPYVLAHELGHFFGNPQHSETPGNVMSYERGTGEPFFDDAQKQRIRAALRRMVEKREIEPLVERGSR